MTPKRFAILLIMLMCLGLGGYGHATRTQLDWRFVVEESPNPAETEPVFGTVFEYAPVTGEAHSPAIRLTGDGFSLIWFEGSRESANDVRIMETRYTRDGDSYVATLPAPILDRHDLGRAFYPSQLVMTLGNTIENQSHHNALYATVVSLGGWAMASVADVRLGAHGPEHARKLNLSPLLNRSHLVKSPMVRYADGHHALPVYFEMGNSFSEVARIGPSGRVVDKARIPQSFRGIQPLLVPLSEARAVALMRNFDHASDRLLASWTIDGGRTWSRSRELDLPNPNSPIAAVRLSDGRLLMAYNNHPTRADLLMLAVSKDEGHTWTDLRLLEDANGDEGTAARYPMMRWLDTGEILLVYSHSSKRGIRALLFNEAWVNAQ